jgi:hypothetical protein
MQSAEENLVWHSMLRVAIGHAMNDDIEKNDCKIRQPGIEPGTI